jgi:hypothetical protein
MTRQTGSRSARPFRLALGYTESAAYLRTVRSARDSR